MQYMFEYCSEGPFECWEWFNWLSMGEKVIVLAGLFLIALAVSYLFHLCTRNIHL